MWRSLVSQGRFGFAERRPFLPYPEESMVSFSFATPARLCAVLVLCGTSALAQTRGNAACPGEDVFFDPGNGQDIAVPRGYRVSVFAKGLNFPTGIAFRGS